MGKCHVTMVYCEEINTLLDELDLLVCIILFIARTFDLFFKSEFYPLSSLIYLHSFSIQSANDIDLKPVPSRSTKFRSFTVCCPSDLREEHDISSIIGASYFDNSITWYIMEVREDGLVLKTKRGEVVEHCPYDGIVNMTFSPKTKIICIWRRSEGITLLKKYHTKKV